MAASPDRSGPATAVEQSPLEAVLPSETKPKKRNPAPGLRVVGRRIYDPEHGKTCHQCRQKTTDFAASCKQLKKRGPCTIKYCKKCLLNRYGESAEQAQGNDNWTCPKCRGICNCSFCRKKNGEEPTGIMAHLAKASGCASVHDLLEKGSDVVAAAQVRMKVNAAEKQGTKRARETDAAGDEVGVERDENVAIDLNTICSDEGGENINVDRNANPSVHIEKKLKHQRNVEKNPADERLHGGDYSQLLLRDESPNARNNQTVLPKGTAITNIAGVHLDSEDVGAAIQLYAFCRKFAEFFQMRNGQPEKILQDIVGGRKLRSVSSCVAEFHITLLSVIQEGRGKKPPAYARDGDEWVIDVGECISESSLMSKELSNCLNHGVSGYKDLSLSCKLQLLNFLCDEALCTEELRKWMDTQNVVAAEPMNAAREKALAAKEKEKELKERLRNSMDEAAITEENKDLISQIKETQEVKRAAKNDMAILKKQRGDLWTKPLMVEKGLAYWKLEGYCEDATILLQVLSEHGDSELSGNKDKWFMFTEDEEKLIEKYIATRPRRKNRKHIRDNGLLI